MQMYEERCHLGINSSKRLKSNYSGEFYAGEWIFLQAAGGTPARDYNCDFLPKAIYQNEIDDFTSEAGRVFGKH
jgi:hypothetical protein